MLRTPRDRSITSIYVTILCSSQFSCPIPNFLSTISHAKAIPELSTRCSSFLFWTFDPGEDGRCVGRPRSRERVCPLRPRESVRPATGSSCRRSAPWTSGKNHGYSPYGLVATPTAYGARDGADTAGTPLVSALLDAVDQARRAQRPHHGMAALQRAWRALWGTAVLGLHARCGARFARASLGPEALAAVSWPWRHSTRPWDARVGARVRGLRRHAGLTCGSLGMDESATKRAQSATTLAHRYTRRDQDRGGDVWGHRLVFLLVGTPALPRPGGGTCSPPAPALRVWDKQANALKQHHVPTKPPPPPPPPSSPTTPDRALRL